MCAVIRHNKKKIGSGSGFRMNTDLKGLINAYRIFGKDT